MAGILGYLAALAMMLVHWQEKQW